MRWTWHTQREQDWVHTHTHAIVWSSQVVIEIVVASMSRLFGAQITKSEISFRQKLCHTKSTLDSWHIHSWLVSEIINNRNAIEKWPNKLWRLVDSIRRVHFNFCGRGRVSRLVCGESFQIIFVVPSKKNENAIINYWRLRCIAFRWKRNVDFNTEWRLTNMVGLGGGVCALNT